MEPFGRPAGPTAEHPKKRSHLATNVSMLCVADISEMGHEAVGQLVVQYIYSDNHLDWEVYSVWGRNSREKTNLNQFSADTSSNICFGYFEVLMASSRSHKR